MRVYRISCVQHSTSCLNSTTLIILVMWQPVHSQSTIVRSFSTYNRRQYRNWHSCIFTTLSSCHCIYNLYNFINSVWCSSCSTWKSCTCTTFQLEFVYFYNFFIVSLFTFTILSTLITSILSWSRPSWRHVITMRVMTCHLYSDTHNHKISFDHL